jgi:hypothetical protein
MKDNERAIGLFISDQDYKSIIKIQKYLLDNGLKSNLSEAVRYALNQTSSMLDEE